MIALLLASLFTVVELNCENLFDTVPDPVRQDREFVPDSPHRWTGPRYWRKLNRIGQVVLSCGETGGAEALPDLVALTEVENDTVMRDLTRRSLLRQAGYEYVMTDGPDLRGIDVALLYSPFAFRLITHRSLRVSPLPGMRPTRDILYVSGELLGGDTLHVFVVHAPSRSSGERATRPHRELVARRLTAAVDSLRQLSPRARVLILGDFNDYAGDASLQLLTGHRLTDVSAQARGSHGARGTYRYHGIWGSLDHIFCDERSAAMLRFCAINDAPFLMEPDTRYGGMKPRRTYLGPRYLGGFSDHLPLVAQFRW
jgi:endonuclease/exonuclease/phosphatase family metal-dependent hydrolase